MRHICAMACAAGAINRSPSGVDEDASGGALGPPVKTKKQRYQMVEQIDRRLIGVEFWLICVDGDRYLRWMRHFCAMMRQMTIQDAPLMRHLRRMDQLG